jgi:ABC-type bacteriocin/lantibiotic exporter with double-glycine peptidase domain
LKEQSAFRRQQDPGTCGQRSLIHALLLLGHPISERRAFKACGVTRREANQEGTDEKELLRAIKYLGYRYSVIKTSSRIAARQFINRHLSSGSPIIISVQNEEHWAVLAGRRKSKYVWIDSADDNLMGFWRVTEILDWMKYRSGYYGIAIKPKR